MHSRNNLPHHASGAVSERKRPLLSSILSISAVTLLCYSSAIGQECDWLFSYIKDSLPPAPVEMRRSGDPIVPSVKGVFPTGPDTVTLSSTFAEGTPIEWRDMLHRFTVTMIRDLQLPIEVTSDQIDSHILIYFFVRPRDAADGKRLLAMFRNIPSRPGLFYGDAPVYDMMTFTSCWTSWRLTGDAVVREVTVFIPFESSTGDPVAEASTCIREGVMKGFGVGLNRHDWSADCDVCRETDRRMAAAFLKNNNTARKHLTVEEVVRELAGTSCGGNR